MIQNSRVGVDPHRRQSAAADVDFADAIYLRKFLLQDRRGEVVYARALDKVGRQREHEHGCVGGIYFFIAWIARQIRW